MPPMLPREKRLRWILGIAFFLIASILFAVLPTGASLALCLAGFLVLILRSRMSSSNRTRFFGRIWLAAGLLKLLGGITVLVEISALPPRATSPAEFIWKYFPLSLYAVGDIGDLEANVAFRRSLVGGRRGHLDFDWGHRILGGFPRDVDYRQIDPFTGKPYAEVEGNVYSLGPDQRDHRLIIIYDPSNGTFSAGDIPRSRTESRTP